jgi:hypothetical protein
MHQNVIIQPHPPKNVGKIKKVQMLADKTSIASPLRPQEEKRITRSNDSFQQPQKIRNGNS